MLIIITDFVRMIYLFVEVALYQWKNLFETYLLKHVNCYLVIHDFIRMVYLFDEVASYKWRKKVCNSSVEACQWLFMALFKR